MEDKNKGVDCHVGQNKGVDCHVGQNKGVGEQHADAEAEQDKPRATPQMSMKRGLKLFGDDGVKAVTEELKQLHDREVMKAKHSKDFTLLPRCIGVSDVPEKEAVRKI